MLAIVNGADALERNSIFITRIIFTSKKYYKI